MSVASGPDGPGARCRDGVRRRGQRRPRAPGMAFALAVSAFCAGCNPDRSAGPDPRSELAELTVVASATGATISTLVVRVSAADIQPMLVFNLALDNNVATGTLRIPAGSARTISVIAFDEGGLETHRGERTLDVRPGPNNPAIAITLLPIAGAQPIAVWLGTANVKITQVPSQLRVDERATLAASVTVVGPDGPVPIIGAEVRWATATPANLTIDPSGLVTGLSPGTGTVAATYAGVGALADITIDAKLGYYVAVTGTAEGDGSWERPWDLATALAGGGGRIVPGDVIWLRGGVYAGDFRSTLTGSPEQQVVVRQYRRERATIEGRLRADGAFTSYWGFEIRQADPMVPDGPPALEAYAPGAKYINLVIHDAGENGISFRTATGVSEIHGCILFNNGNTQGLDHGIYASSEAAVVEKLISDNILFNNIASGIQVFGDETHPTIANVTVVGNISFNNSSIAVDDPATTRNERGGEENIVVGGDNNTVENITIRDNLLYFSAGVSNGNNLVAGLERELDDLPIRNVSVTVRGNYIVGGFTLFSIQEWEQATVDGNTFVADPAPLSSMVRMNTHFQPSLERIVWTNNTQYRDPANKAWRYANDRGTWDEFKAATWLGASDNVTADPLTATKIIVRPNKYEPGRAHIAVHSPTGEATVAVDVSTVLQPGDRFEVRNVQDIFGPPLLSGVYSGVPLTLPMTGVTPPPASGRGPAPVSGPYFNAFLLTLAQR
jgi:hypothetical protein